MKVAALRMEVVNAAKTVVAKWRDERRGTTRSGRIYAALENATDALAKEETK